VCSAFISSRSDRRPPFLLASTLLLAACGDDAPVVPADAGVTIEDAATAADAGPPACSAASVITAVTETAGMAPVGSVFSSTAYVPEVEGSHTPEPIVVEVTGFVEDYLTLAPSCLETAERSIYFHSAARRLAGEWMPVRSAGFTATYTDGNNEVCKNYAYGAEGERFLWSSGGAARVGPPSMPGDPRPVGAQLVGDFLLLQLLHDGRPARGVSILRPSPTAVRDTKMRRARRGVCARRGEWS